ncbi:hypothetical protein DOLIC_00110 [Dolichomitus sp. PSUC_FEM 10030005]|nr:hypothetical protein [Dolichomitus sp. PSUC_FEM 10030005]
MSKKLTYTENLLAIFIAPSVFYLYLHYFADIKRYLSLRTNDNYLDGSVHELLYTQTRDYYINEILPRITRGGKASLNIEEIQRRIMPRCRSMHASMLNFSKVHTYRQIIERFTIDNFEKFLNETLALSSNSLFIHGHENLRINSLVNVIKLLQTGQYHNDITASEIKNAQDQITPNGNVTAYDVIALPVYSLAGNDPLYGLYSELERNYDKWTVSKIAYYNRVFLIVDRRFIVYFDVCDASPIFSVKNHKTTNKAIAGSSEALSSLPFRQMYVCIPTIDNPYASSNVDSHSNGNLVKVETNENSDIKMETNRDASTSKQNPVLIKTAATETDIDNKKIRLFDFLSTLANLPVFEKTCLPVGIPLREPEDYIAATNCWHKIVVRSTHELPKKTDEFNFNVLQEIATIPLVNTNNKYFNGTIIYIRIFDNDDLETFSRQIVKFGLFNITNHASFQIGRIIRPDGNNTILPKVSIHRKIYTRKEQQPLGVKIIHRLNDAPIVSTIIALESPSFIKILQCDTIIESQISNLYRLIEKIKIEVMLPVARCLPFLFVAREISPVANNSLNGIFFPINKRKRVIVPTHRISMHSWYNRYTGILIFDTYRVWPRENNPETLPNDNENVIRSKLLNGNISIVRNIDNLHTCLREMGLRPYGGCTRQIIMSRVKLRLAIESLRITTVLPSDVSLYVYYISSRHIDKNMSIDDLSAVIITKDLQRLRDIMIVEAATNDTIVINSLNDKTQTHKMPLFVSNELINYMTIALNR